jgi:hypothetical protein
MNNPLCLLFKYFIEIIKNFLEIFYFKNYYVKKIINENSNQPKKCHI